MAQLIEFPRRMAWPVHSVDDYGRDPHLVSALGPLARLRWDVSVGGTQHLPISGGALLVSNSRRWALNCVWAAWALSQTVDRPVRFVGRPDIAPIGPFMRRIGGLLDDATEVQGALEAHELVIISTSPTSHPRHAGTVSHDLVGAAVRAGVPVFPVATMSSTLGRSARAEVGSPVRPRRKRRGPLAEVELADQVQYQLQRMLDAFGGMQTGVAPIDWLAEG
jgi:hypothetical protein